MVRIFYDLHIHSCLSPCGDGDMTVNNIVNMAVLKELELIALTDHNSSKNCPAFLEAAARAGIRAVAGMELNTAEEVHTVCLFPKLDDAMAFDAYVYDHLPAIENQAAIFGAQTIVDARDEPIGEEGKLLINATDISYFELDALMETFRGIYFPAHIDRNSFSLLSNLGFVPPDMPLFAYEIADMENHAFVIEGNPTLKDSILLANSDAHYLWDIAEAERTLPKGIGELLL